MILVKHSQIQFWCTVALCLAVSGCGGSSGGGDEAGVSIISPTASTFRAGESFLLEVETTNFTLSAPPNLAQSAPAGFVGSLQRSFSESAVLHTTGEAHSHEVSGEGSTGMEAHTDEASGVSSTEMEAHTHSDNSDQHSHNSNETNPNATQGHMHIYLDGGAGSDAHITSWSNVTEVQLPVDLSVGTHSLRIELRDDFHTLVNPESDEFLIFEVVE